MAGNVWGRCGGRRFFNGYLAVIWRFENQKLKLEIKFKKHKSFFKTQKQLFYQIKNIYDRTKKKFKIYFTQK
jgi:hypothetical protein